MNFKVGDILPNTPHLFADLAELVTLINFSGRNDLHKNDLITLSTQSNTSIDEIDQEQIDISREGSDAERSDRQERQLEDVWTQLEYRQSSLGDAYPFIIEGDFISLKENLTPTQRVYNLLVACSRLWSFKSNRGLMQKWAKYFTIVSKYSLTALLPAHASVRIFDANSDDRRNYYGTDLRQALRILGKDLAVPSIIEAECDKADSSGDAGFDLIATVDFLDGLSSNFGILGQCGAQGKEWPKKTLEAHAIKLRTYYQVHFDHPAVMFTPVFYRDSVGDWVDSSCCPGVIILDRARILHLLAKTNHIEEIIAFEWFSDFENAINTMVLE
ncbi:hypothetical protein ACHZIB_004322 [Yersinia enterocolitica]|uniref:hypothetical protein n=1 Tax=Yersinia TaxID=629 RepID=UPI001643BAD9|nr:hypothetical protein [Yersinia hibernica]ELI8280635.1 hypothetical protein [Yersinia enterocolitica]ELW9026505.1 hypothetical protein [Yersinia enterocolitica]HDL6639266.1 hypothetical protein [Yersinia enterocolitica]HDL6659550.1 hypothetical protein [Yersinia enterocolitica]HDL6665448.1 hypothetical protein [Yersinia enterocolitica]